MTKLVRYVCRAKDHQQLPLFDSAASWAPNTLTFYGGWWAYCPGGNPGGHDWEEIPAQPFDKIRDEFEESVQGAR